MTDTSAPPSVPFCPRAGKQAEILNMIIRDLWEGKPVSERQLLAVLRSPGATDYSNEEPSKSSLEEDEDRELTLSQLKAKSFDEAERDSASGDIQLLERKASRAPPPPPPSSSSSAAAAAAAPLRGRRPAAPPFCSLLLRC